MTHFDSDENLDYAAALVDALETFATAGRHMVRRRRGAVLPSDMTATCRRVRTARVYTRPTVPALYPTWRP